MTIIPSDIEISKSAELLPIKKIAENAGFKEEEIIYYGPYKAKISEKALRDKKNKNGRLVLVTAINPTPFGEGKTTTTIGLGDALNLIGKNTAIALR